MATVLSPEEARAYLVGHHGLRATLKPGGAAGVRALLTRLRCIQLDPLDVLGTNADLVVLARVDGISRGDVYRSLMPGFAFEHKSGDSDVVRSWQRRCRSSRLYTR